MDPPGRVNNLYKERIVVEPEYEFTPIVKETSQGCKFARTAGYGTLEYCTQPTEVVPMPPRYFQLDENVKATYQEKTSSPNYNLLPLIILFIIMLIIWRS